MYCPKCGKQLDNDSSFCKYCGNRIDTPKPQINVKEDNEFADFCHDLNEKSTSDRLNKKHSKAPQNKTKKTHYKHKETEEDKKFSVVNPYKYLLIALTPIIGILLIWGAVSIFSALSPDCKYGECSMGREAYSDYCPRHTCDTHGCHTVIEEGSNYCQTHLVRYE